MVQISLMIITTTLLFFLTTTISATTISPDAASLSVKLNPCSNDIDGKCIQWAVSKLLGFLVVSLAFILKVPQIKNMIAAGNADGLDLRSLYLDLFSYATAATYSILIHAPLTTYAETLVIAVQVFGIIVLSWNYKNTPLSEKVGVGIAGLAYVVTVIGFFPSKFWPALIAISSGSAIFSRLSQIVTNFKQGHTGVLALLTVALQVAGNLARVYTTYVEVDDFAVLASYLSSLILNATIMIQICIYWKATVKYQEESQTKKSD